MARQRLFYILLCLLLPGFSLHAQVPVYDFVSPGGQAQPTPIAPCNQLSDGNQNQVGAAWINYALTNDSTYEMDLTSSKPVIYDQTFQLYLGETDLGADGMAFVIRDVNSNNLGAGGHGMGYGRGWTCPVSGTCAIQNSIAIEIDVHPNGPFANDPTADHLAIMLDGHEDHTSPGQLDSMHLSYNVEDGRTHLFRVRIESTGGGGINLIVWFDSVSNSSPIAVNYSFTGAEINSIFPSPSDIVWGFTSATGSVASSFLFGQQPFCDQFLASLPVELIGFNAQNVRNQYVELDWLTAQELNNDHFEILRNNNGSWEVLGRVEGAGTTDDLTSYRFIDPRPYTGVNHYRLRQVDYDGAFAYSSTIAVGFNFESRGEVVLYPNPATDFVTLHFPDLKKDQSARILIFDAMGRMVKEQTNFLQAGQAQELQVPTLDLPAGMYHLKFVPSGAAPVSRSFVVK